MHAAGLPLPGPARGVALPVTLFILIVILLVGASAAQLALQGEKAARGERERHTAFQAAEEALIDAENDLDRGADAPGRSALFAPDSALGFSDDCGAGADSMYVGLCLRAADDALPVWQSVDLADAAESSARSVPYGAFTGAVMQTGAGFLPARRPRYLIELLPYMAPGEEAGAEPSYLYRITAIGFGARDTSQVVLQSFYRKQFNYGSVE